MTEFDLAIRGGLVVSDTSVIAADVGIVGDHILTVTPRLPAGRRDIDAAGRLVMPGGVDTPCHVEQLSGMGRMGADDRYSASVSAAFGATTTIAPFAARHRGASLKDVAADYAARAAAKSVIDYSYHLIVTGTDAITLQQHLPELIRAGVTSFKDYMTYEQLRIDDHQMLDVLALAAREEALVMIHAENNDVIRWVAQRLLDKGHHAPHFHGVSHVAIAETEATGRAIQLSRLFDVPILIVHVFAVDALATIAAARAAGAPVYAETCPNYFLLTGDKMDQPHMEGAKFCCSLPLRDEVSQVALWVGLAQGTLQTLSSDHAPYRFDTSGKLPCGHATTFKQIANGLPGLETRLPLLFLERVGKGRLTLPQFVALGATNHACLYGLHPPKGLIAPGADAYIAIWNPDREVTLSSDSLHDQVGYTPDERMVVRGWPEIVIGAGRVMVEDGRLHAERGSGRFIPRTPPGPSLNERDIG